MSEPVVFTYPDGKTITVTDGKIQSTPGVYHWNDPQWIAAVELAAEQKRAADV